MKYNNWSIDSSERESLLASRCFYRSRFALTTRSQCVVFNRRVRCTLVIRGTDRSTVYTYVSYQRNVVTLSLERKKPQSVSSTFHHFDFIFNIRIYERSIITKESHFHREKRHVTLVRFVASIRLPPTPPPLSLLRQSHLLAKYCN